ncbi:MULTISPECIES: HisA/HisF-related TIM barrel protein [Streptomyces]|uniref:HisA/HisF-related TIM barrel protein n=1 Tax=Streptomyces TaxID=1883 RepID=UPI00068FDC3E|nr:MULTISPECIES: HisA/HisF-related TIM barrel protein [Streptomyces]MDP9947696.1 cyclase [Streptomyces sp. DSM 41269]
MSRPVFHDQHSHIGDLVIPCIDVSRGRATEPSGIPHLRDPGDVLAIAEAYASGSAQKLFLDVFDSWDAVDYLPGLLRDLSTTGMSLLVSVGHGDLPSTVHAGGLLEAGADVISVSTALIDQPDTVTRVAEGYGAHRLMGVVNCRSAGPGRWRVYVHDGERSTGRDAADVARQLGELGVAALLANNVDREGTGVGFDLELVRAVATASGLPVIASGGCGSLDHLHEALGAGDSTYVLVNAMVHRGTHSVREIRDHLLGHSSFRSGLG